MEYDLSHDGEVEKTARITVPRTDLDNYIDGQIKELQKTLSLKGFRKGKVPENIIRARYADSVKAQALNDLINDHFIKLVQEKKWIPASQAQVKDINEGETITFTLQFEIIPQFTVEMYKGIELFKDKALPDDMLYENALQQLKEQYATVREISRPAAVDDIVTMDLVITEKDKEPKKESGIVARIGDRNLPDEVNRVLVGSTANTQKTVEAGEKKYSLTIEKIEEKIFPTIDESFARTLECNDLEDLKKKVMDHARAQENQRQEEDLKEKLSNVLLERVSFQVPKSHAENEYQKIIQRAGLEDSESIRERFWDTATKRARLNLILDWIAHNEGISVSHDDIQKVITAMNIKTTDDNRNSVENYVKSMMMRERTLDFLYSNAQISEKKRIVSPKEAQHDTHTIRH